MSYTGFSSCTIHTPAASHTKLYGHHLSIIYEQLYPHSARWQDIGIRLQFTLPELNAIQAAPAHHSTAPSSYMSDMLCKWLQWAPGDARGSTYYATLKSLKTAMDKAGLGVDAQELHI